MAFLRNAWYMAAWASELPDTKLLARRFLNEPVVMFRDNNGTPKALADRCPHRFAPLSMGKLCDEGASVQCGYHGLRFDTNGMCVLNPHGDGRIPKAATVRSYPLVERWSALWIWMGESEKADPSLITDFHFLKPSEYAVGTGYMMVDAPYELETDNILDLSHIEYLHPIFSSDGVHRSTIECAQEGDTVWSKRFVQDDDLPNFLRKGFRVPPGHLADRWMDVRWNAPAQMALFSGAVASGRPRNEGVTVTSAHIFTPESAERTHYFYGQGYSRQLDNADELADKHVKSVRVVFENEDRPMLEAVADRMEGRDLMTLQPILLSNDAAAIRARRILKNLIDGEAAASNSGL